MLGRDLSPSLLFGDKQEVTIAIVDIWLALFNFSF
jgi:hypothetical protein